MVVGAGISAARLAERARPGGWSHSAPPSRDEVSAASAPGSTRPSRAPHTAGRSGMATGAGSSREKASRSCPREWLRTLCHRLRGSHEMSGRTVTSAIRDGSWLPGPWPLADATPRQPPGAKSGDGGARVPPRSADGGNSNYPPGAVAAWAGGGAPPRRWNVTPLAGALLAQGAVVSALRPRHLRRRSTTCGPSAPTRTARGRRTRSPAP